MSKDTNIILMDINTKDITIDELGQRDVNRRRAQYKKIMREFDKNLVQPISVALIDGKYYCFDGQMTMKVLKDRNNGEDLNVQCRVYNGMTKLDAAMMFINQRGTTSDPTLLDKLRVKANYGDETASTFFKVTELNGLEISWTKSYGKNAVVASGTLWNEYTAMNDVDLYAKYIRCIKQAWNGDQSSTQSAMLRGVGLFFRTYKDRISEEIFVRNLGKKRPIDMIRDAQADRSSGARKYAVQVLQAYNFALREDNRLPNLL